MGQQGADAVLPIGVLGLCAVVLVPVGSQVEAEACRGLLALELWLRASRTHP